MRRRTTKKKQQLLGLAAPKRTKGQTRFEHETLKRGGPYEVQGKRWRAEQHATADQMADPVVLADLRAAVARAVKRMPK
jgi:hypothetical protein